MPNYRKEESDKVLTDCHAHLEGYEPEQLEQILERAEEAGVGKILGVSNCLEAAKKTLRIAEQHSCIVPTVGIHPWHAEDFTGDALAQIGQLARNKSVAAIGEVGLDFVRDPETKEGQIRVFEFQVKLARELGLPLIIHTKGAHAETMAILKATPGFTGVIHGFTGDEKALTDWLNLGLYISIGIHILGAEATGLSVLVKTIPDDRLLFETDTTVRRTVSEGLEPAKVAMVTRKAAEIRGIKVQDLENITAANFRRALKLP